MTEPELTQSTEPPPHKLRSIVKRPWLFLLLGVVLFLAAASGLGKVSGDFTPRAWFGEDDPNIITLDEFEALFGNDESLLIAVRSPSGIFDLESADLLVKLTDALWKTTGVLRVDALTTYNWVHADPNEPDSIVIKPMLPVDIELTEPLLASRRQAALNHESLPGYLISPDGETALIYATLEPRFDEQAAPYRKIVGEVFAAVDALKEADQAAGGDHIFHVTGFPAEWVFFEDTAVADMSLLLPAAFLVIIVLMAVFFRRVTGVVLPLVVAFMAMLSTIGIAGWLGIALGNIGAAVPQIIIAVSIADAVHILTSYYRALGSKDSRREAAFYSLHKNFKPTLFTTVTTSIGFLTFSFSKAVPIGELGVLSAVGIILAWVFTYAIIGSLIVILPIKAKKKQATSMPEPLEATERSHRISTWLQDRRKVIIGLSVVLTAAAIALTTQNQVNTDPHTFLPDDAPFNIASDFIEEHVGGSSGVEIIVSAAEEDGAKDPALLRKIDELETWLRGRDEVSSVSSLVSFLKATNRALHDGNQAEYRLVDDRAYMAQLFFLYSMGVPPNMDVNNQISLRNDRLRITVNWFIRDSMTALDFGDQIRAKAKELGLDIALTGQQYLFHNLRPYIIETFLLSVVLSILTITLILMIVFRSWWLGLLSLVPNVLPPFLAGAVIYLMGRDIDPGSVMVFAICLGIAVDDTIHFLAYYQRGVSNDLSTKDAVACAFTHAAPALLITTVVLVSSFGLFIFGSFLPNAYLGSLMAVVLVAALAADLTLLPAILMGKRRKAK